MTENPFIPHPPTPRQAEFLALACLEAFYGGSAGGGKSDALLMAALQFVGVPGYAALLLRRTYTDLSLPGALMDRAHDWLGGTGARWSEPTKTWHFPAGSSLSFGYLDRAGDERRYKSAEFQMVGLDELSEFDGGEAQYAFLFSRLRGPSAGALAGLPLRMRSASNPGGPNHQFVKARFIDADTRRPGAAFVPASLADNPHLDRPAYLASLSRLPAVERARLLQGDWSVHDEGIFTRAALSRVAPACPVGPGVRRVRYWDKGYSARGDYSAGVRMSRTPEGQFFVEDVVRGRWGPTERNLVIVATAEADRLAFARPVRVYVERPPGAGAETTDALLRQLAGHPCEAARPVGRKEERAEPFADQCGAGNVLLVAGPWLREFVDELCLFPAGANDDQVDAASGAFLALAGPRAHAPAAGGTRAGPAPFAGPPPADLPHPELPRGAAPAPPAPLAPPSPGRHWGPAAG